MTARPPRSELRRARLRWLLDLTFGGQTIRIAEDAIDAPDPDGTTRPYRDGLHRPAVADSIDLFQHTPQIRDVAVTVDLDRAELDVGALVAAGHRSGTAILRLWVEDSTGDAVLVDVRGRMSRMEYRDRGGRITFSLRENPYQDRNLIPGPLAFVSLDTWPNSDPALLGTPYPWIFGQPGHSSFTGTLFGATPGLVVGDAGTGGCLVSGTPVAATSVTAINVTAGWELSKSIIHQADGLGTQVAIVNGAGGSAFAHGDEVWIAWTGGGGMKGRTGAMMRGAGEILRFMLQQTSLRVDWGRVEAVLPRLDAYKIDGYVMAGRDARLSAWTWVQQQLLPLLPVSVRVGPQGLYFVLWHYQATTRDAVDTLRCLDPGADTDTAWNCQAAGPVLHSDDEDIVNEIRFRYARSQQTDTYRKTLTVTGSAETARVDDEAIRNLYCVRSDALYGRRTLEMTSDIVSDAGTAWGVVNWKIRAGAFETRELVYRTDPELAHLSPGDAVQVEDPEVGITGQVGHVEEIGYDDEGDLRLRVRTLETALREE